MLGPKTLFLSLLGVAALAMTAACTRPTPYQPASADHGEGYTTQRLETNRFRVSFRGNTVTSRQTVDTYMLYRAAEVTLLNGYDYFVVVNRDIDKNTAYQNYGDDLAWGWGGGWGWRHGGTWARTDYSRPISSYDAIADIILYRGPKPAGNRYAYDAHEVLAAVGPTVVRFDPAPGAPLAAAAAR